MSALSNVLDEVLEIGSLGGPEAGRTIDRGPAQAGDIRAKLEGVRRIYRRHLWLYVGLLVLVFVIMNAVVLTHLDEPKLVAAALAALAGSVLGVVKLLGRVRQEAVYTELLLALGETMEDDVWRTMLLVTRSKLLDSDSARTASNGRRSRRGAAATGAPSPIGRRDGHDHEPQR